MKWSTLLWRSEPGELGSSPSSVTDLMCDLTWVRPFSKTQAGILYSRAAQPLCRITEVCHQESPGVQWLLGLSTFRVPCRTRHSWGSGARYLESLHSGEWCEQGRSPEYPLIVPEKTGNTVSHIHHALLHHGSPSAAQTGIHGLASRQLAAEHNIDHPR